MFRWFISLLLAVGIAGGVAWHLDLVKSWTSGTDTFLDRTEVARPKIKPDPLYTMEALPQLPPPTARSPLTLVLDPCHLVARYKQEVSNISPKDGHLLFVGQLVTEENALKPGTRPAEQTFILKGDKKLPCFYRPWEEGDIVEMGQMLAMIDPTLALNEVIAKQAKVEASQADWESSGAYYAEATAQHERLKQLRNASGKITVSDQDLSAAKATVDKYFYEKTSKKEAIKVAEVEKQQADVVLQQHEMRSAIKGKIKKIYKQTGDGVKTFETVMQLQNLSDLRVEGMVDAKDLLTLREGMKCYIEPSIDMGPEKELMKAHTQAITSVAVCADGQRFVSGSDDSTVCIWQRGRSTPLDTLYHKAAVRVVACSPPGSPKNWLLVGCAEGSIYLYDLDNVQGDPRTLKDQHRGGVTALAFSPKGTYFASGGEDNAIRLYETAKPTLLYPLDAMHGAEDPHQGTVTALHFTPQAKLVSAARDNTLRVWSLYKEGVNLAYDPIKHRGGAVNHLGVSQDGRYMLFDQGKTLQLRNVADGKPACVLENLAGTNIFETVALFSPDGSLMLTGGADEGRLRLWKTPAPEERGYQVRELVSKDRAAMTCASFAPTGGNFAVTGSKEGYVHIWTLPNETTVKNHRIMVDANGADLRVDSIDGTLDAGKTRLYINVLNPQDRLKPGQRVTLVVVVEP